MAKQIVKQKFSLQNWEYVLSSDLKRTYINRAPQKMPNEAEVDMGEAFSEFLVRHLREKCVCITLSKMLFSRKVTRGHLAGDMFAAKVRMVVSFL